MEENTIITSKRTVLVLMAAAMVLILGALACSVTASQLLARRSAPTATPTRTQRPTWTPASSALILATPTIEPASAPAIAAQAGDAAAPTPQVLVPGAAQGLVVPQGNAVQGVQTVVVILVTATPPPPATPRPSGPTFTPLPTETPGPPTATPLPTGTPMPPVLVHVTVDRANVRQGPGVAYPLVTALDVDTVITVVGRNRAGDWWKICCVNGSDVWIADSVVTVEGPLWTVAEITDVPPAPTPLPTAEPTLTPTLTPTYAWTFHLETAPQAYELGQNIFRVDAVIYTGTTPLWGYQLRIRKLSTGQEWLSEGSQTSYACERLHFPMRQQCFAPDLKYNVKWDSNLVQEPMGDDVWEVTVVDGAGTPQSAAVRLNTSSSNSKWYYLIFSR